MFVEQNNSLIKIKYVLFFVFRAFLLSIAILFALLCILFLVYYVDLFKNVKTGNYKNPLFNGYVIVSQSMVPTIKINDAIVVKRDNNNNYDIGDIISFFSTEYESKGIIVTHRVISKSIKSIGKAVYHTKGDNNSIADKNEVSTANIYGKVILIIPKLGYIQSFFRKPINILCCVIIPVFIIIICDFIHVGVLFRGNKVT